MRFKMFRPKQSLLCLKWLRTFWIRLLHRHTRSLRPTTEKLSRCEAIKLYSVLSVLARHLNVLTTACYHVVTSSQFLFYVPWCNWIFFVIATAPSVDTFVIMFVGKHYSNATIDNSADHRLYSVRSRIYAIRSMFEYCTHFWSFIVL